MIYICSHLKARLGQAGAIRLSCSSSWYRQYSVSVRGYNSKMKRGVCVFCVFLHACFFGGRLQVYWCRMFCCSLSRNVKVHLSWPTPACHMAQSTPPTLPCPWYQLLCTVQQYAVTWLFRVFYDRVGTCRTTTRPRGVPAGEVAVAVLVVGTTSAGCMHMWTAAAG